MREEGERAGWERDTEGMDRESGGGQEGEERRDAEYSLNEETSRSCSKGLQHNMHFSVVYFGQQALVV